MGDWGIVVVCFYQKIVHANLSDKRPCDICSNARDPNFKPINHLHPYFVYASSEGSGESVQMHRLA